MRLVHIAEYNGRFQRSKPNLPDHRLWHTIQDKINPTITNTMGCDFDSLKYISPALCSMCGIVSTSIFAFWCQSFLFEAVPAANGQQLRDLRYGPWYRQKTEFELEDIDWQNWDNITIFYQDSCTSWENEPDPDGIWTFVRAVTIINPALAAIFTILICATPCLIKPMAKIWGIISICFSLVMTSLQGLAFLIYSSNACEFDEVNNSLLGSSNAAENLYEQECSWDVGSGANIGATGFWLATGLLMMVVGIPYNEDEDDDNDDNRNSKGQGIAIE